jgi:hypothetical protein
MFVIESSRAERGQAKRTLGADCGAYSGEGPSQRFDGTSSDQLKRRCGTVHTDFEVKLAVRSGGHTKRG